MVMSFGNIGMGGMSGYGSGNVYQSLKEKYGTPADFRERPVVAPYPLECVPKAKDSVMQRTWFGRLLNKFYN